PDGRCGAALSFSRLLPRPYGRRDQPVAGRSAVVRQRRARAPQPVQSLDRRAGSILLRRRRRMRSHDGAHPDRRGCGHARPRGGAGARRGRFRLGRRARRLRARACRARRPRPGRRGRTVGQAGSRFGRPPLIAPSPSRRGVIRAITAGAAAALWPATVAGARSPGIAPAVRLRRGVNLWPWFSLTREFPPPRTDYDWPPYEPARAVPTRRDLAALHHAGIDFVRLPVDPGPLIAFSGERRTALIGDVIKAVELALAQNL